MDDEHAVIWTKPEDWSFDPKDPTRGLGRFFDGGFNAGICDGSVLMVGLAEGAQGHREASRHVYESWR